MNDTPLVSVLMTSYNRELYIEEAIRSVVESSYTNWELIITDDCSADKTVAIARGWAEKDSRIKVHVNEKNLGDYPNRNNAASLAKGEYIIYVDSDDKIEPDGIRVCVQTMQIFPGAAFGMYYPYDVAPFQLKSKEAIYNQFFIKPFLGMGPGGTILRRSFFKDVMNYYPVKYGPANDMFFNIAACSKTDMVMIPYKFMYYRIHAQQESKNKFVYLYQNYNLLKDALASLDLPLTEAQKNWIARKSKRRFFVNIVKFFFSTYSFQKTVELLKKTQFGFRDLLDVF